MKFRAWVIVKDGYPYWIHPERRSAISQAEMNETAKWNSIRKMGFEAVRCTIDIPDATGERVKI